VLVCDVISGGPVVQSDFDRTVSAREHQKQPLMIQFRPTWIGWTPNRKVVFKYVIYASSLFFSTVSRAMGQAMYELRCAYFGQHSWEYWRFPSKHTSLHELAPVIPPALKTHSDGGWSPGFPVPNCREEIFQKSVLVGSVIFWTL
jgi:hypothetical protein